MVNKVVEGMFNLDSMFFGLGISDIGKWIRRRFRNYNARPYNSTIGGCNSCYMYNDICIASGRCVNKESVLMVIGLRYMLSDLDDDAIKEITNTGKGEEQLVWFNENESRLPGMLEEYKKMLDECGFLEHIATPNDHQLQKLDKHYQDILKKIEVREPVGWMNKYIQGTESVINDDGADGEYPPGWDRRANEIKFDGKGCCHRCGAKEDHVCERVNVMLYYYVIFASKTFSKYRGKVQLFEHWMKSLMNSRGCYYHQIILTRVVNKLDSEKKQWIKQKQTVYHREMPGI